MLEDKALIEAVLMAATCAVDIAAICVLERFAISLDEVAAMLATESALISAIVLLEILLIADAMS